MMVIEPLGDGEPFSLALLSEASALKHKGRFARLTDMHLRAWATYDMAGAVELAEQRDAALAEQAAAAVAKLTPGITAQKTARSSRRYVTRESFIEATALALKTVLQPLNDEVEATRRALDTERERHADERDILRREIAELRAELDSLAAVTS